jgi:hypothetical protein
MTEIAFCTLVGFLIGAPVWTRLTVREAERRAARHRHPAGKGGAR